MYYSLLFCDGATSGKHPGSVLRETIKSAEKWVLGIGTNDSQIRLKVKPSQARFQGCHMWHQKGLSWRIEIKVAILWIYESKRNTLVAFSSSTTCPFFPTTSVRAVAFFEVVFAESPVLPDWWELNGPTMHLGYVWFAEWNMIESKSSTNQTRVISSFDGLAGGKMFTSKPINCSAFSIEISSPVLKFGIHSPFFFLFNIVTKTCNN